jgi:hypothetical protein
MMTRTLDLPADVDARVQAEAARHSLPVEDYLLRLVTGAVAAHSPEDTRERSLALLDALDRIGDEQEQRETFEYLKAAVEVDRLSDRGRF